MNDLSLSARTVSALVKAGMIHYTENVENGAGLV